MLRDQSRLLRRLTGIERGRAGEKSENSWKRLSAAIELSCDRRTRRADGLPQVSFSDELPVSRERLKIAQAIESNPLIVVCGETGSGKTTQLPKICLSLGRGVAGLIGHTQPRRIAARSVANRIADELNTQPGEVIGYKTRFQHKIHDSAYVKLMTDGILLAELQGDRFLGAYDTLIIDEAHERSLNIDFLLGYIKQILPKRPELRVIVTSATIDPERFSRHFDDAPVIEVSGRSYPVDVHYRPRLAEDSEQERDLQAAVVDTVDEARRGGPGDILIFLPGERDIRQTAESLRKHHMADTEVLPLYARLNLTQQDKVFSAHGGRRIVLATNVAETSLTVPNIRYVIDPGLARISRYSRRSKIQRLPVEAVSQASADQRKGRCGRVGPGVCYRLYSEDDFENRPQYTEPEIRRTNLAAVILQMKALDLGDIESFPFVDPPDRRYISDGYRLLGELGAVDGAGTLTVIGRRLARLPVDPRIGRMILEADVTGALEEVLVIASALSIPDPRERSLEKREAAQQAHREFQDKRSDFQSLLSLWNFFQERSHHLSRKKLKQLCEKHYLSYFRMWEWRSVHTQLLQVASELGLKRNQQPADYAAIHQALLTGLLSHLGFRDEENQYQGARGARVVLGSESCLAKKPPKWIMAAELVDTGRVFARTVATIEPAWAEAAASHLVSRSHTEPYWDEKRGEVMAFEQVSLYGLTLASRRRTRFAPIDPDAARSIFLREALAASRLRSKGKFLEENRALVDELIEQEHRLRTPHALLDESAVEEFYARRVPTEICDQRSFEKWRREGVRTDPKLLFMIRADICRPGAALDDEGLPEALAIGGLTLALDYHFDPGSPQDGITVTVPLELLNQVEDWHLDWLVPRFLPEKIQALLRSLPKSLRRNFVPLPEFSAACADVLITPDGPLKNALARELLRMTGVQVPVEAWKDERVPEHLLMNVRVTGEGGALLAEGRSLSAIRSQLGEHVSAAFRAASAAMPDTVRSTDWDFGELSESVNITRGSTVLQAFPALVDCEDAVELGLLETADKAAVAHQLGLLRLFRLQLGRDAKYLRKNLPGIDAMCLEYMRLPGESARKPADELRDGLVDEAVYRCFVAPKPIIRSQAAFVERLTGNRAQLVTVANGLCEQVAEILRLRSGVREAVEAASSAPSECVEDIQTQLRHLVERGFFRQMPEDRLRHLPRYLEGMIRRIHRLQQGPSKDQRRIEEFAPFWERYVSRPTTETGESSPELETYRWMLEEWRVSLFAQELGTSGPISPKRLDRQWEKVCKPSR